MSAESLRALEAQLSEVADPVLPEALSAWVLAHVPASSADAAQRALEAVVPGQRRAYECAVTNLRQDKEQAERAHPSIAGRVERLALRALRQNLAVFALGLHPEAAVARYRSEQPALDALALSSDEARRFWGSTAQLRDALDAWEAALDRTDAFLPPLEVEVLRERLEHALAVPFAPTPGELRVASQDVGGYGSAFLSAGQARRDLFKRHEQRQAPLRAWLNDLPAPSPRNRPR